MTLLPRHYDELVHGSGIAPEVIERRGYRSVTADEALALGFAASQARAGIFMPAYSLAGVQVAGMLKPDEPRVDADGRTIKYEWPANQPHVFDAHPDMLAALKTRGVLKWFSEGHKKTDAAASRGLAMVNLAGVWTFLHGRLVVPDLDELPLDGERCYVCFDSDVTRKPSVAEALLRFCAALHRRGAQVFVVYLPEGANGAKVGLDDWFVAGGTVDELSRLAQPWDGNGPGVWLRAAGDADPAELARVNAALTQAILNPENSRADLMVMASVAGQAMHKAATGATEPDGRVVLTAAEIANDYRSVPERGEHIASVNPKDGTKPRMARAAVKKAVESAIATGRLQASPRRVRRAHPNGNSYVDTEWLIDPGPSLAALLNPWATYRPSEPTARKPRTTSPPCPHCGEVHPIQQRDYCAGCGGLVAERVIAPKVADESTSDNFSEVTSTEGTPSPPAPVRIVGKIIRGDDDDGLPEEPDWLAALIDDPTATPTAGPFQLTPLFSEPPRTNSAHFSDVGD